MATASPPSSAQATTMPSGSRKASTSSRLIDLEAAAVYLLSLAPQPPGPAGDGPGRGTPGNPEQHRRGARLYADRCANCHGDEGQGAPGIYPPLAGNPTVTLADASNAMQVIRHGGFAPSTRAQPWPFGMPPAGLSPQELADVLTYLRQSWGNQAGAVSVLEALRAP